MHSRESILSQLIQYFGEVKYTSYIDEVRFCCPYCQRIKTPDVKFHLYINLTRLVGFCFRCNYILSPKELKRILKQDTGRYSYIPLNFSKQSKNFLTEIPEIRPLNTLTWSFLLGKYGDKYPAFYSEDTNYSLEHFCKEYGLVYASEFHSLMIPLFWFDELVGFQMRRLEDSEGPKYLTFAYRDHNVSGYIFNFDRFYEREDELYIVEGIFDGLPFAFMQKPWVAVFGKNVSKDRIRLLSLIKAQRVYIVLDGDAWHEALNLAWALQKIWLFTKEVYLFKLPDDKDPADLGLDLFNVEIIKLEL